MEGLCLRGHPCLFAQLIHAGRMLAGALVLCNPLPALLQLARAANRSIQKPASLSYICLQARALPCYGHTTTNTPDPIRTRKLSVVGLD